MRYRHIPGDRKIHRRIESEIDNVWEAENATYTHTWGQEDT